MQSSTNASPASPTRAQRLELLTLLEERAQRARQRAETPLAFIPRVSVNRLSPDHLSQVSALFERIDRGECVRACVSIPPQHGKTDFVQHALPWLLSRHPTWSTIYATYSQDQSDDKSHGARDIARRAGLSLSHDRQNLRQWRTSAGGGCLFTAVDGPASGQPARLAVVDDPYKGRSEALSATVRAHVERWFSSVILQRGQEGMSVVVVHTRWCEGDLISRLAAGVFGAGWEVINLPMVARADGTPSMPPFVDAASVLNPLRHTAAGDSFGWTLAGAVKHLRGLPEADALSLAQGVPRTRADGALWQWDWITPHRAVTHPELSKLVIGVDPSVTGHTTSAETGIIAVGVGTERGHRRAFVLGDRSGRFANASWDEAAVKLHDDLDADAIVAEVNNGGDLVEKAVRTAAEAMFRRGERRSPHVIVRMVRASRGKATRAEPAASLYQRGFVSHVGALGELERELTSWDPATTRAEDSPGRVDALVWALDDLKLIHANGAYSSAKI